METTSTAHKLIEEGERVSHLYPNDCYFAHLSIYGFASQFCLSATVLDAGSGAGYGTAYLATHGAAEVIGIDASEEAVAFSQEHFSLPNAGFRHMALQDVTALPSEHFDVVLSSNVLEHVSDPLDVIRSLCQRLRRSGTLVVAVPPVDGDLSFVSNLENRFHINLWTPQQWVHTLSQFFAHCQCYTHECKRDDVVLNFLNTPEDTRISEEDFIFRPVTVEEWQTRPHITFIAVGRELKPETEWPNRLTFIDDSLSLEGTRNEAILAERAVRYWHMAAASPSPAAPAPPTTDEYERRWAELEGTVAWKILMRARGVRKKVIPAESAAARLWFRLVR